MKPLVIFGVGELGQLASFYFRHDAGRVVAGFVVDAELRRSDRFEGLPFVGSDRLVEAFPPTEHELFVAVGYSGLNAGRRRQCEWARAQGYTLASYISSRASVWPGLVHGDNCFVMEGNTIQPFVRLGDGVLMFTSSVVSHHAEVGDYVFIGAGAILCGGVNVGAGSFIGAGATVRERSRIGRDCIVGAGTLILGDTADGSGYLAAGTGDSGIPSRRLKSLL